MIGLRLDKALSLNAQIHSRSRAEYLINLGLVRVNNKLVKSSYKIRVDDEIRVDIPEAETSELKPLALALDIVFEDEDLIVLNKPSGLVVHPAAGHSQDTLVNALIHHTDDLSMKFGENRPGIVHRLDRDTSGLLVIAKNDFTHEALALQFKNKTNHRIYYAVVIGVPKADQGTIQSFLARHPTDRKKYASVLDLYKKIIREPKPPVEQGRWAITHYRKLSSTADGLSFLQLKLETGRTHQIRVHLSELQWNILADDIYTSSAQLHRIKSAELRLKIQDFPRLALHAAELGFKHPRTGEEMMFKQDWPPEIKARIKDLGLT